MVSIISHNKVFKSDKSVALFVARILASLVCMSRNYLTRRFRGLRIANLMLKYYYDRNLHPSKSCRLC